MKSIMLLFGVCCAMVSSGCGEPKDASHIHGGSTEMLPKGEVHTLRMSLPTGEAVVAIVYPGAWDSSRPFDGEVREGNGDDPRQWMVVKKIPLQGAPPPNDLNIGWKYTTRNHKLVIADKSFALPMEKVAVIRFDQNLRPTCELLDNTPQVIAKLRNDLGAAVTDAMRAKALPALPADDR